LVTPTRSGVVFEGGTVSGYSYVSRHWDGRADQFKPGDIQESTCSMAVTRTETSLSRP
jgi:hypothetical protein